MPSQREHVNASSRQTTALPSATQEFASTRQTDEWIAKQASFAQPILHHLRGAMHEAAPDCTEEMKWSRPFFAVEGRLMAYIAAFKQHCGFGFWSPEMTVVLAADGIAEPGASGSFGRIASLDDLPSRGMLLHYIRHAAELARTGTGGSSMPTGPRRSSAKVPIPVPPEFTAALATSKAAQDNFHSLAPSCRREYLEWITSAKKQQTRDRRVQEAVARLAEGKHFNDRDRAE